MPFSTFVSYILDPLLVLPVVIIFLANKQLPAEEFVHFIPWFVVGGIVPVVVARWFLVKTKKVSDWDMGIRKERVLPFLTLLVFGLIQYIFVVRGMPWLQQLMQLCMVWFAGLSLITLRYKISGHVGGITLASGLLILFLGWSWWPVLLTIPLVAWARVVGKHHTLGQTVAGFVYTCVVLIAAGKLFI